MNKVTFLGMGAGLLLLGYAALTGGPARAFLDTKALAVVFGGLLITALLSHPPTRIAGVFRAVWRALREPEPDLHTWIERFVHLAALRRRSGLLALEEEADAAAHPFLTKALLLAVDGTDAHVVRDLLELEIAAMEERHRQGAALLDQLARLSPAFGLVGTLIGLIRMLGHMSDPRAVGPGMAVALVATLYGVVLANVIFAPLATRLKVRSSVDVRAHELILEGVLALHGGESPHMMLERLQSFLPQRDRRGSGQLEEE